MCKEHVTFDGALQAGRNEGFVVRSAHALHGAVSKEQGVRHKAQDCPNLYDMHVRDGAGRAPYPEPSLGKPKGALNGHAS